MFCPRCGRELHDDAVFCDMCGKKIQQKTRPLKRSPKPPQEIKPPPLIMRIILVLCSAIIICVSTGTLLVNFISEEAEATILSTNIYKRLENEKYLYVWDVTYEFYANGKKYIDSDNIIGPRGSINTFGYHVNYLSFAPEISRLSRGTAVSDLNQPDEIIYTVSGALICFIIELTVSYFLLWVAFPKIPFFGFGKKKNKKRKK